MSNWDRLSAREQQVARLSVSGISAKQVAAEVGVAVKTIHSHRASIYNKLGVHSITDLSLLAFEEGVIKAQKEAR